MVRREASAGEVQVGGSWERDAEDRTELRLLLLRCERMEHVSSSIVPDALLLAPLLLLLCIDELLLVSPGTPSALATSEGWIELGPFVNPARPPYWAHSHCPFDQSPPLLLLAESREPLDRSEEVRRDCEEECRETSYSEGEGEVLEEYDCDGCRRSVCSSEGAMSRAACRLQRGEN